MLQLVDALGWCLDLGITCVSVYAFSIDNFKRSQAEVAALMDLAENKLEELLQVGLRLAAAMRGLKGILMTLAGDKLHGLLLQVVCVNVHGWCSSVQERGCSGGAGRGFGWG